MLSDPTVWGPLLVAGTVYWAARHVGNMIHAANLDRREDHQHTMEILNCLPNELDDLKTHLWSLDDASKPRRGNLD